MKSNKVSQFPMGVKITSLWGICLSSILFFTLCCGQVQSEQKNPKSHAFDSALKAVTCHPSSEIKYPKNVGEIQQIVKDAVKHGKTVKPFGSLHSMNDIMCTDGIPISLREMNTIQYNEEDETVSVGGAVIVQELMEYLEKKGRTLANVPTLHVLTVIGAIGTGAHGSSLIHPASISDQTVSLTIVDGNGAIQEITTSEDVKVFKLNLGLLGIVTMVKLRTVPLFKLKMENYKTSDSILTDGTVLEIVKTHDHVSLFWFPLHEEIVVVKGKKVPIDTRGNGGMVFYPEFTKEMSKELADTMEDLQEKGDLHALLALEEESMTTIESAFYVDENGKSVNNTVGYAWRVIGNKCKSCFWEQGPDSLMSNTGTIVSDFDNFYKGISLVKEIVAKQPLPFPQYGMLLRFTKASDGLIDPSRGKDLVHFEWLSVPRKDGFKKARYGLAAMQAISQSLVNRLDGRGHWGKNGLYFSTPAVIKKTMRHRDKFIGYMKKYDPHGVFLNKFGRRLLGESEEMDGMAGVKHCAILEHCVCSKDDDCAEGQQCVGFMGAMICKDKQKEEL